MQPCRVILQGFGPFGAFRENPSSMLVEDIAGCPPQRVELTPLVLPVSHRVAVDRVAAVIEEERPDVWLGIGLSAGRTAVAMEQVAVNVADYAIDDVDGSRPCGVPILDDGPAAHLTSLPARRIVDAWRSSGVPGYLSYSAGAYLCNETFYRAAAAVEALGCATRVGFLHVPLLPAQVRDPAREPSMTFDLQRQAVAIALECISSVGTAEEDQVASSHSTP